MGLRIIMKKDNAPKKGKKRSIIHKKKKNDFDEYGDKRSQKIDYEKDRPPHW